jgi:hypothetical protein
MSKLILTDVDGVLLNWNDAFDNHMASLGYNLLPENANRYSLSKRFNVERSKMDDIVTEFNQSDAILKLEPFRDAVKGMSLLASIGFRFVAVTNIGDSGASKHRRTTNLLNVFGDVFDSVICLPIGVSKYSTLAEWEDSGLYWIEDKFSNALDGHSLGLKSILIDADYNKDFMTNRFPRVSNETPWEDIFHIMITDYFKS